VVGVDLEASEVSVDLADRNDRQRLAEEVARLVGPVVDGVLAVAGVVGPPSLAVRVNFFGVVATLEELRPALARSRSPRAAAVSSFAATRATGGNAVVDACLALDEEAACEAAENGLGEAYASSKAAVNHWVRRAAVTPAWAGAGIALNAVAPGIVRTPMTTQVLADRDRRAALEGRVPMALSGPAEPDQVAELLVWLCSSSNTLVTGQVIFADGGAEAVVRGSDIW
jgi:NAD(P)-dependent dehydrogenase (short-subunit alcohol dehydrogenase family)